MTLPTRTWPTTLQEITAMPNITYTKPVTTTPAHPITGRIADVGWDIDPATATPYSSGALVLTLITDNEALVEYVDIMPLDERPEYTIGEMVTFAAGMYRLIEIAPKSAHYSDFDYNQRTSAG